MRRRNISRGALETVIAQADSIEIGPTAVIYDDDADGRPLRVVMTRGASPALVITVHERDR